MELHQLKKITESSRKRVGRGYGSGKGGHTSGRGTKGQLSRRKMKPYFEGTAAGSSLLKRLPLWRGKGKHKSFRKTPLVINLKFLADFKKDEVVDLAALVKKGFIKADEAQKNGLKILGDGELKVALTVKLPCSKQAQKKIEKAGGKVILDQTDMKKPAEKAVTRSKSTKKQ